MNITFEKQQQQQQNLAFKIKENPTLEKKLSVPGKKQNLISENKTESGF